MSARRDQTRMVLGAFVVLVGVLALLDNLLHINTRQVLQFWPVVFMLFGLVKLTQTRHLAGYVVGAGFVALGLLMTLNNLEVISFRMRDWWPVLVIAAGVAMIARDPLRRRMEIMLLYENTSSQTGELLRATAVMSGNVLSVVSQDFRGGEVTALMGGVEVDFRQASMQSEATVQVLAVMGGVDIKVPPDWGVECRATVFLGGVEDKTVPPAQASKRLVIEGFVMMGGVQVSNK
jgi:predicted membrane protein